jgi:hypothetical protein
MAATSPAARTSEDHLLEIVENRIPIIVAVVPATRLVLWIDRDA